MRNLGKYLTLTGEYEEALEYWRDADFEIEAIEGAREGLARLTS